MLQPIPRLLSAPGRSINLWLSLKRNKKAQHITRWLLGLFLILCGLALQEADVTRSTPLVMEQSLPVINFETFSDLTLMAGFLCFFTKSPSLFQWALLCAPIFIYTFYTIKGVAEGIIAPTSIAGVAFFVLLCLLLCVTFYGYSED